MKTITTINAPEPGGHYSQAIVHGGFVFVSGLLPIDPANRETRSSSIEDQTLQVLKNLQAILEAAGSSVDRVIKVTVYIPDINLWGRLNTVYSTFFGDHKPARAVVPTRDLHFGYLVEMEAVAAI